MSKEQKNNNTKEINNSSGNGIIIILVVIIICLVFTIGYLLGNKHKDNLLVDEQTTTSDNKKDTEDEKEPEPTKEENNSSENKQDNDPKEISYLALPEELCGGVLFPFEEKNINVRDLDTSTKVNMLLTAYKDEIPYEEDVWSGKAKEFTITDDDFKKYYDDTRFLEELKQDDVMLSIISPYSITYDNNKYYLTYYGTGCIGPSSNGSYAYKIDTKNTEDYIIDTYKYYYRENTGELVDDKYFEYNLYKDHNKKVLIAKTSDKEAGKKYEEQLSTYDVYYKIDGQYAKFEKMVYHK